LSGATQVAYPLFLKRKSVQKSGEKFKKGIAELKINSFLCTR